jgi:tripartite-type tricarboxylate transporter receptor subunit TctC
MDCRVKPGNDRVEGPMHTRRVSNMRHVAFLALIVTAFATAASAASYPDHPIRLIVPQAAGSATDNTARILAAELTKELGQLVIVDDRPGGALTLGLDLVAKSVSPKLPVKSIQELIAYAKANPGKLTNASSSNGSPGHVGGELFKFMTGTKIVHVPYRGGALAIQDLMAGRVDIMFESLQSIAPSARAGLVRPLGVSGATRSPAFPDLPTIGEAVPGYLAPTWTGVIAPAGVPRPIVDKLNAAINQAIKSEAFKEKFAKIGDEPGGGTPEDFAATIRADSAKWGDVIKRAGIKF